MNHPLEDREYSEEERNKIISRGLQRAMDENRVPTDLDNPFFEKSYDAKFDELYEQYWNRDDCKSDMKWIDISSRLFAYKANCRCNYCKKGGNKDPECWKVSSEDDLKSKQVSFESLSETIIESCDFLRALLYEEGMNFSN